MSNLTETVVSKPEIVVRERRVDVKSLLSCDSDFELVLCSCISNYLEVVDAACKGVVRDCGSEVVVGLKEESVLKVCGKTDLFA